MKRIMVIFGTRPEAIKLAPVIMALAESRLFTPLVTVTGQHREMLDQILNLFSIVPQFDLNIIRQRQSLAEITTSALEGLYPLIASERPDLVLVQGDTTTTFVASLSAYYNRVPVAHLEAGLRTQDLYSPFPEEANRRLTSRLAALHLAPTTTSKMNLLREGIDPAHIVVTGNTVIDTLLWAVERASSYGDPALHDLDADPRRVLTITAHRRESWGQPMEMIAAAISRISQEEPDLLIVFPIHRNPIVREAIQPILSRLPNVRIVEPLGYAGFIRLLRRSSLVMTDSGGVQEEAPSLGKPVLVMRDNTERPEAVRAGTARLVGTDPDLIVSTVRRLLHDSSAYSSMANAVNPYGDGLAGQRTLAALAHFFEAGPRPADFDPGGDTFTAGVSAVVKPRRRHTDRRLSDRLVRMRPQD
jgi:UDP-N-acetylglucosamine 2-epimerase (non-hydrolysing)